MAYLKIDYFSEVLNRAMQMGVILPEQEETVPQLSGLRNIPFQADRKLPVLYILHGLTDNYSTWLRNTSIERYASEKGIAVVLPDGYMGFYTNMCHGYNYFDYLSKEIPKVVHEFLPCLSTRREDTFAAGNSMGAYGALKWALACPEQIFSVGLFSGSFNIGMDILNDNMHFPLSYWNDVFGDIKNYTGSENDLSASAKAAKANEKIKSDVYMWTGESDWLLYSNRLMKDELLSDGFHVIYRETQGDHSWSDWDREILNYMDWIEQRRTAAENTGKNNERQGNDG